VLPDRFSRPLDGAFFHRPLWLSYSFHSDFISLKRTNQILRQFPLKALQGNSFEDGKKSADRSNSIVGLWMAVDTGRPSLRSISVD
jgi:hypothetical protein